MQAQHQQKTTMVTDMDMDKVMDIVTMATTIITMETTDKKKL